MQFQNLEASLLYHRADFADCLAVLDSIDLGATTRRTSSFTALTRAQCYVDLGLLDEAITGLDSLVVSNIDGSLGTDVFLRAQVELARGNPGAAYDRTVDSGTEGTIIWLYVAATQAQALAELGRRVDVDAEDTPVQPSTESLLVEIEGWRVLESDPEGAAELFAAASEESRRWSVPPAIRQAWAAGEAARRAGRYDAVALLEAVEEEALSRGMAPMVARVRRSLRAAGVARGAERRIDRTGLVTAREREVLDLVARGFSNVEIARRLGVSRPTVRRLLDNARAKLGARDRVEAAAILAAASR
jgi:DNA-binding CsgD family transcriptional regulator